MLKGRLSWQEELAIIDETMRAISSLTDPEELVDVYWEGIGKLIANEGYVAMSRRNVEPPYYLITRSSRFAEQWNPWTQREKLPRMTGGLLGEIVYEGKPRVIDDLPAVLSKDDPAYFYLEGFSSMIVSPQYDGGVATNFSCMLLAPGEHLDKSLVPILHWQSGLFGRGTQNMVLRNQLAAALGALERELQVVGEIQRSLLPGRLPQIEGYDLAAHYQTSARAGGDYYDLLPIGDGKFGILIADVSGHGTPAAVLMSITHAIARSYPQLHGSPKALLAYLNDRLATSYTGNGTFVTAFYGVLDPQARTLTYARAGHNPPRLARGDRVISLDGSGGPPLGIVTGETFGEEKVALQRGDLLLLYTDGITETMAPLRDGDADLDLFGTDRLDELLLRRRGHDASACVAQVRGEVASFSENAPPADDQTLVAVRVV